MSEFQGFSEAAQLYVENLPIVDAMRRLLEDDMQQFHKCLRDAIQSRVGSIPVGDKITTSGGEPWHSWWVSRSAEDPWNKKKTPYVTFSESPSTLVLRREMLCYIPEEGVHNLNEKEKGRIAGLADDPELQKLGIKQSSESWALLEIRVVYPDSRLVEKLAPVIAALLQKFNALGQFASGKPAYEKEAQTARERFERHFGAIDLGRATGADNESIDADLVREYGDNHGAE